MMAALLAGALWLNMATAIGAPVSTTHSIVGGVLGAGIAAGGWGVVNWDKMGQIAASWVISPVVGGIIAAAFLYLIKRKITYKSDMLASARRWVPILVGIMSLAFTSYLALKGLKKLWKIDVPTALLSFAHGANDVANSVGPLAAVNDALMTGDISSKAAIPMWVMMVGAVGIAIGLALYGPKLIRAVGSEITELDQMRAFCIALSAAITVIIATQLGLPASSTHIAVGAIFGVGFLREYLKKNYAQMVEQIHLHHMGRDMTEVEQYLDDFQRAALDEKAKMLKQLSEHSADVDLSKKERRGLKRVYRHELVKRSALLKIVTAWVITVPVSALLAAMLFFMIRGMMLP